MNFFKTISLLLCVCFLGHNAIAQQITGQILDSNTNEPVAFATVQYGQNNGVVSNMEGFFTVSQNHLTANSPLTISFMGYQTLQVTIKELESNNHIIKLEEAVNQLNTVYINTKLPDVDSIMARVHRNLTKNYKTNTVKQTLFTRKTTYFKPMKMDVDITKSSGFKKSQLETSNEQFDAFANEIMNNPPTRSFTDVLVELYQDGQETKMTVPQATRLIDSKNNVNLENIQSRVAKIVLKHLDTSKTYKLKTGWFKIEDSLSLNSFNKKKDEKPKEDKSFINLKSSTLFSLNSTLFETSSVLDFVKRPELYNYELKGVTTIDDQLVYIINFEPRKSRAKYKGSLFIADEDYAIMKLNYGYAEGEHGDKLNLKLLFGVKFIENVDNGTVIYKKSKDTNTYYPYYINRMSGRYMYAHRPLKFIENDDDSSNKVAFDLIVEGTAIEKYELMSLGYTALYDTAYDAVVEPIKVDYIQLKQYDPSLWKDHNILEPLEELKKFKVEE